MKYVGQELEKLALSNTDSNQFDLLGRSAFNRYYYAAFLITRETLGNMQSNWKGTAHAEIPNLLRNGLRKPARASLRAQVRAKLIDQGEESKLLTDLNAAANELAEMLETAYDARILADYEPEIKTMKDGNVISLKTHKLTTASQWPGQAEKYCARLRRIWRSIGLGQ